MAVDIALLNKQRSSHEWHLMRMLHGPYCYDEHTTSPRDKEIEQDDDI